MQLPEIYTSFCEYIRTSPHLYFIGSDFAGLHNNLQEPAIELLAENNTVNFLTETDFVFLMHQGYIFLYFSTTQLPDPDVWIYTESDEQPRLVSKLSSFLEEEKLHAKNN